MSGEKPRGITSAETSLIVYKILSTKLPGGIDCEYLLDDMLSSGVFQTAYPLHDGTATWSKEGHLTDRQVNFSFQVFCGQSKTSS